MIIKSIELKDFRNYESLNLQFNEKVNLILGNNAQGKTNLIEAISITSLGKSFRTSKDYEMIKFGKEFCRVKINALKDKEDIEVEIAIANNAKAIKIDGIKAKKTSELLKNIYVVIFSPEDLKIVKDEPEKRRRFIDRELCQIKPSYYVNLSSYKKALIQRNFMLKEKIVDRNLLSVWDDEIIKYGSAIIIQRDEFVSKINDISKKIHSDITGGNEILNITYESNIKKSKDLKEQQEIFRKELEKNIDNDIRNRTTGKGPHKDDLKLEIEKIDLRHYGSQGQQRTAALSLKLAQISLIKEETGEYPVLLLDDVMSELDKSRQKYIINSFENIQLFITTTDVAADVKKAFPEGKIFYVENGVVL